MKYPYSIDDLARIVSKSKQSIYNLLSKDKAFINENSIKQNRKIKYNQAVLDMILQYYDMNAPEVGEESVSEEKSIPSEPEEKEEEEAPVKTDDAEIERLRSEIEALKKDNEEKSQTITKLEAERVEMVKQNGMILSLLQEEKREKMLLLEAPKEKKSLFQRIVDVFKSNKDK